MSLRSVDTQAALYEDHEVKQELVLGPFVLQSPDSAKQLNGQTVVHDIRNPESTMPPTTSAAWIKQEPIEPVGPPLGTNEMVRVDIAPESMSHEYEMCQSKLSDTCQELCIANTMSSAISCVKQEPHGTDSVSPALGTDEMVRLGATETTGSTSADNTKQKSATDSTIELSAASVESQSSGDIAPAILLPMAGHLDVAIKEELLKEEAGSEYKNDSQRRSRRITDKQKAEEAKKQLKQTDTENELLKEVTKFSRRLQFETDSEESEDNTGSEYEDPGLKHEETDSSSDKSQPQSKIKKTKVKKPKKRHICNYCSKEFGFRAGLTNHIRIHTGEKPFTCKICSKKFSDCAVLVRHRRMHSGDRPHVCDVCGKKYSEKFLLKNHKLIHTGEMQYSCKFCPKQFINSSNFRRHQKVHMHKYVCDMCQRHFAKKDSLVSHIINHMKPKPYTCRFCKKGFGQSGHLHRHERTHSSMKKMYPCAVCKLEFTQKSSLKRHLERNVCKNKVLKK